MLLVSNSGQLMMSTSTCNCTDVALTLSSVEHIIMVQVSWGFYSNNGYHSAAALALSILFGYCVTDFRIPNLVLL